MKIFLYSFFGYSCHLFLISSASVRSLPFLSFIGPIFAWHVPLVSLIFFKRSLVFPIQLFSSVSSHWSLRKTFLSLLAVLWNSAFRWIIFPFLLCFSRLFFSQIFVRPPQTAILLLAFLFLGDGLTPCLLCNVTNVHQALCLSDLIPWICLSLQLYNRKGFDLGHTWMV